MKASLSIVMPALDEEAHIEDAAREAIAALGDRFDRWEILLIDDGSRDRTGALMDALAARDPHLRVTHNPRPRNLGGVYKQGIALARYEYFVMIPGDNENPAAAMQAPFEALGSAEIIVPYPTNRGARSPARELVSSGYVGLLNLLSGLELRYYNGTVIHRTDNLRGLEIETDSFAYQSEVLVKLLRRGLSYREVGIEIEPKSGRRSKAFRWKNVVAVAETLARLALSPRAKVGWQRAR